LKKDNDIYVPDLADKFMLGYDYLDKKTKQPLTVSKRMEDYKYVEELGIPPPPIGWYMSEKFDGQRALWDGEKFVTRGSANGYPRVYPYVPDWFITLMPPGIALDGEFYTKRSAFQEIGFLKSKLSGKHTKEELDKKWIMLKYQVFDLPTNEPFEKRMESLEKIVHSRCKEWDKIKLPSYLTKGECPLLFTKQYLIKNENQIDTFYNELVSNEAEGIMIRAPKIPYIPKRTRFMLKLKPEEDDECVIVGYKPGEGKYKNMLGSFLCEKGNKQFYVGGMTDEIRKNYLQTHPVGTKITYKFTFLTDDNLPRHPRYKGIPGDR
jgi:DNA ligase-1